jgi:hypothetical protein
VESTREHRLEDILFIATASVICGAESWNDMESFGKAKAEWLKTFLVLPGGIPSHDTFNRLFSSLHPEALEKRHSLEDYSGRSRLPAGPQNQLLTCQLFSGRDRGRLNVEWLAP